MHIADHRVMWMMFTKHSINGGMDRGMDQWRDQWRDGAMEGLLSSSPWGVLLLVADSEVLLEA